MDKLLTCNEVEEILGLGRTTIYEMVGAGRMPAPLKIGKRAIRWDPVELREWLDARPRVEGSEVETNGTK